VEFFFDTDLKLIARVIKTSFHFLKFQFPMLRKELKIRNRWHWVI